MNDKKQRNETGRQTITQSEQRTGTFGLTLVDLINRSTFADFDAWEGEFDSRKDLQQTK